MQEVMECGDGMATVELVVAGYKRAICDALNKMEIEDVRRLVLENERETSVADQLASPARRQAAEVLRLARRLPVGPDRNDLRQLAIGLLWLDERGLASKAFRRVTELAE
jgi:hypothetical protein